MNELLYTFRAHCTYVVDGDTADFVLDKGMREYSEQRVRLIGVDAPEMHAKDDAERARAQESKAYLLSVLKPSPFVIGVAGWQFIVKTSKGDSFGRYLADVWGTDGVSVNAELVRLGLARVRLKK
jgi:micrococcal nuclease